MAMPWPDHLLTLDEWDELPEDNARHYELVEGVLSVTPKPLPAHQKACGRLMWWLDDQLPEGLAAYLDIEVTVKEGFPPSVRAPDVVVTTVDAVAGGQSRISASDVLIAVEIMSPGTVRTDRLVKPMEYAEAGIPAYWCIDIEAPVTLTSYRLVDGNYRADIQATGRFFTEFPVSVAINLDNLTPPRLGRP